MRRAAGVLVISLLPLAAAAGVTEVKLKLPLTPKLQITGDYKIDIAVFNADSGEKVLEDIFRDFKEFDQRNYDEILGLFENLRSLETQLVGIFVPQETSATRYVFTE